MKVLIATDGEAAAVHAIRTAMRLLPLASMEIVVVSVLDPEERIGGNENCALDLEQAKAILAEQGLTARTVERRGHFADEILAEAKECAADLLVLGHTHRGRLARLVAGSVSDTVVHRWMGAVLLVGLEPRAD